MVDGADTAHAKDMMLAIADAAVLDLCSHFHVKPLPRMQHEQRVDYTYYYGDYNSDWLSISLQPGVELKVDETKDDPAIVYNGWEVYFLDGWFHNVMLDDLPIYALFDDKAKLVTHYYDELQQAICDTQVPLSCYGADEM